MHSEGRQEWAIWQMRLERSRRHNENVDLRDFESIVLFFSEEEIEELQATIDERRMKRLAREEGHGGSEVAPDYPPEHSYPPLGRGLAT